MAYPVSDADEQGDSAPSSGLSLRLLGLGHAIHIQVLYLAHPECKAQDPSLVAIGQPNSWPCAVFNRCNGCTKISVLLAWPLPDAVYLTETSHASKCKAGILYSGPQSGDWIGQSKHICQYTICCSQHNCLEGMQWRICMSCPELVHSLPAGSKPPCSLWHALPRLIEKLCRWSYCR